MHWTHQEARIIVPEQFSHTHPIRKEDIEETAGWVLLGAEPRAHTTYGHKGELP